MNVKTQQALMESEREGRVHVKGECTIIHVNAEYASRQMRIGATAAYGNGTYGNGNRTEETCTFL